jgi:GTP-binding protein YchF
VDLGLVGLPGSGKTTLFHLLTGAAPGAKFGVAPVTDPRLAVLARIFRPRRVTPATLRLTDIPGVQPGRLSRGALNEFLEAVRRSDALLHVVGCFAGGDPAAEARSLDEELILADLERVESVAQRLAKNKARKPDEERAYRALTRCAEGLGEGVPIRRLGVSEEDAAQLSGYGLLTAAPELVAANMAVPGAPPPDGLAAWCAEAGIPCVAFCAPTEAEIAALPEAERGEFLTAYGLSEPGVDRLARAAYAALGMISFLTAGEDEVRAWPIRNGTTARRAAGKIHSDIERGFIRAEVGSIADLEAVGSWKGLRERGLLRVEGRDYVVQDGDVIEFRFNV